MSLVQQAPRTARLAQVAWRLGGLVAALTISACGGGGDSSPPPPSGPELEVFSGARACGAGGCGGDSADGSGVGSGGDGGDGAGGGLGAMQFVKVTVTKPDGTVLGSAVLEDNLVSVYPRRYTGPIVLEFADDGSGNGAYFDEGLRDWFKIGSAKFHVLVPALTHHVSANALTEAAYQWAVKTYGSSNLTAAQMTTANNKVRDAFNKRVPTEYHVTDATNYSVAVSDVTAPNSLPNTHAGRAGTLFAAFPRAALRRTSTLEAPVLAFIRQLVADMLDDDTINDSDATPDAEKAYGVDLPQVLNDAIIEAKAEYGSGEQPSPTPPAATTCFNADLFAVGTTWTLNYQDTDIAGEGGVSDFSQTLEVTRITDFPEAGVASALEIRADSTVAGTSSTVFNYFGPDISGGIVNYGSKSSTVNGSTVTTYTPPYTERTLLLQPDSTDSVHVVGTTNVYDVSGTLVFRQPLDYIQSTYMVGYDTVTVPAGTFKNACHYSQPDGTTGGKTDFWLTSSGQGIVVLQIDYDANGGIAFKSELTSGNVNGVGAR